MFESLRKYLRKTAISRVSGNCWDNIGRVIYTVSSTAVQFTLPKKINRIIYDKYKKAFHF